jgi:hypothetical protein
MSSLFFEDCTFNAVGGDIHNVFNRTEGLNVFNNYTFNVTHVHLPPPPRPPHKFVHTGKRATEQIRKVFLKVFSYVSSTHDLLLIAQVTLHVAELDLRYPAPEESHDSTNGCRLSEYCLLSNLLCLLLPGQICAYMY